MLSDNLAVLIAGPGSGWLQSCKIELAHGWSDRPAAGGCSPWRRGARQL